MRGCIICLQLLWDRVLKEGESCENTDLYYANRR